MGCGFLKTLRTLKKHSAESVDFADEISDQSKYLHVHRSIEDDLIALLRSAKQSSNKSLVLLCGSAGDGKSHMLSYLKNSEHADLLEGFNIRNDATESDAPHRTAPETLSKALQAYDDNHIGDGGLEKTVVAINLGLLARFLESPSGENFKELRQYVDEVGLLKTGLSNVSEIENLYFYAVDFSDYQIFLIRDGEIEADFTSTLLERVFSPTEDNPFYAARCKACRACGIDTTLCPVKQNYDFLQNKYVRDNIAEMLVEIALREKCVITARAVLDFIYEALVSPDFDIEKLVNKNAASPREFAPAYLAMTTPQLLFSSKDSNGLISKFTQLDPMNDSSGWTDEVATAFRTSEENIKSVLKGVKGTPYEETFSSCPGFSPKNISQSESARTDIKEAVLSFVIRCAYLINSCDEIRLGFERKNYIPEFVQLLYYYNIGEEKELRYLKKTVTEQGN